MNLLPTSSFFRRTLPALLAGALLLRGAGGTPALGAGEAPAPRSAGGTPALQAEKDEGPWSPRRAGVQQALDVRYVKGDNPYQKLDVFAPAGAVRAPVVLFVHGGTWMGGDKDFFGLYRSVGRFLARHGVVAVLPNYRLAPLNPHPAQVQDIARAYAWARAHAAEYGGDPDRIFLCGHSAGGHLAALLALDEGLWNDPATDLTPADRASLRGVITVSGVYRIPEAEEAMTMLGDLVEGLGAGRSVVATAVLPALLRRTKSVNPFLLVFGGDPKVRRQASPLAHVRKGLPPFLILYAERELPGLAGMATEFAGALKQAGDRVEVHEIPDVHHNWILWYLDKPADLPARYLLRFIKEYGGPPTRAKQGPFAG
jgi:acetyl esterase/lipase